MRPLHTYYYVTLMLILSKIVTLKYRKYQQGKETQPRNHIDIPWGLFLHGR